jgi:hypothetical protein
MTPLVLYTNLHELEAHFHILVALTSVKLCNINHSLQLLKLLL